MTGKSLKRVIVPPTANEIPEYCEVEELLTAVIVSRKDPEPESLVFVTT